MFRITEQQLQSLDAMTGARQDAHMAQVIAAALPELLPEATGAARLTQFAEWIDTGCEHAAKLGIDAPADMAVVVALLLARAQLTAEEQERLRAWAGASLQQEGSSGRLKVALVEYTLKRKASSDALAQRLHTVVTHVRAGYRHWA